MGGKNSDQHGQLVVAEDDDLELIRPAEDDGRSR
jgi:hypothetical protein